MARFSKPVFISFLLVISISASIFMIIEAGTFFQKLYQENTTISFMGYWAAFLNEIFMGIMAAVWLPGRKGKRGEKVHPLNILFKLLLVFLFITTVCGSSLNTAYPLITNLQQQINQEKVIQLLKSQVHDNEESLQTFVKQNQRVNTALSVRHQAKIKEELKEVLANQQSSFSLWLEISLILFIRFGVQLANLSSIWLAGWLYRQPPAQQAIANRKLNVATVQKQSSPVSQSARSPRAENGTNRYFKGVSDKNGASVKPAEQQRKTNGVMRTIDTSPINNNQHRGISLNPTVKKDKDEPKDSLQKVSDIRHKISSLLQSRNEGISLSQVGRAIGEKEANLREIVNPKTRFGQAAIPALENILYKIENLYHEENARIF